MIQTNTFTGTEAQQMIQKLQGISAQNHFISYEIIGTSVVASPNQSYRNDKIGQIEGCLKFFVDYIIFKDSIMGTFREYYADLVRIYEECEQFYKFWIDNIDSIMKVALNKQERAEKALKLIQDKENTAIKAVDYNFNLGLVAQAFIDQKMAMDYFKKKKSEALEAGSAKALAIFEVKFGNKNIILMEEYQKLLTKKFKGEIAVLKQQNDQYCTKLASIDKLVNQIQQELYTIFLGQSNQSLKDTLLQNAQQIVSLYQEVGSLKVKIITFHQELQWIPWMIDHNVRLKDISIKLEVANTILPFLQAELNYFNELYFGERLELGRLKMKDVINSIQQNLEVTQQNLESLQKAFKQLELAVSYDSQTFVTSISKNSIVTTSFTYVNGATLSTAVPDIVDFNPKDVKFSNKTLDQSGRVESLKERVTQIKLEIAEIDKLKQQLLKEEKEPELKKQSNEEYIEQQNSIITTTSLRYRLFVQVVYVTDANKLNIKQVTALLGIILKHLNIEREACCGGTYDITKYTEVSKSYCDIVFAQAIRQIKNQPNHICTTHSQRIKQTDSIKLMESAKLIAQFELFGAYQTTSQDRQIIRNYIRTMDIDNTLFMITIKIAQLYVQEYMISIGFSTLEYNNFIQQYKRQYFQPQQVATLE